MNEEDREKLKRIERGDENAVRARSWLVRQLHQADIELAEKDREIAHYKKRAELQEQAALSAVSDRDRWKARASLVIDHIDMILDNDSTLDAELKARLENIRATLEDER